MMYDDGNGDDEGVRGLTHKRPSQLLLRRVNAAFKICLKRRLFRSIYQQAPQRLGYIDADWLEIQAAEFKQNSWQSVNNNKKTFRTNLIQNTSAVASQFTDKNTMYSGCTIS